MFNSYKFELNKNENNGVLVPLEEDLNIPFNIKRIFYTHNIPQNQSRGNHAYYKTKQVLICISGSVEIKCFDGEKEFTYKLNNPSEALYIDPKVWRTTYNHSSNCVLLILSSHGLGHMIRCLSIVDYILKYTEYNIYIACGKFQNDFPKSYLEDYKDRIIYKDLTTDIGFINKKDSLDIDKELLEEKLLNFINTWDKVVLEEVNSLKELSIKCVINDISPIGCLAGKALGLDTILISNFTWIE